MDDIFSEVKKYSSIKVADPNGISNERIFEMLPTGWHDLYIVFRSACNLIDPSSKVISVEIRKGTLFIKMDVISPVIRWLTDGLAKESTKQCMFTPHTVGVRRKSVKGWPCLSTPLWLEYANIIPETEWETNESD